MDARADKKCWLGWSVGKRIQFSSAAESGGGAPFVRISRARIETGIVDRTHAAGKTRRLPFAFTSTCPTRPSSGWITLRSGWRLVSSRKRGRIPGSVPEPGTWGLVGSVMARVVRWRRRQSRAM